VATGDIDGDGRSDIIVGLDGNAQTYPIKVFPGNGDGTFGAAVDKATIQRVTHLESIDIDGDGHADVVATANGSVNVLRNDGAGNLTNTTFSPGGLPIGLALADVDRDGGIDLLLTDFNGHVFTLLNKCGQVSLTLTPSANPSSGGLDVTFTANAASPAAATATGTLSIAEDGVTAANGGVPSLATTTSDLTIGSHTIVASYSGDLRFYPATRTLLQTVQTAPYGAPPKLRAASSSPSIVAVTWFPTQGVDHYEIQRGPSIGTLSTIGTSATAGYSDTTVAAENVYLYRVRGVSPTPGTAPSAYSSLDYATTVSFTDQSLVTGLSRVKAVHVTELRGVVGMLQAALEFPVAPWTDGSLTGVTIKAVHLTELRAALDQIRSALGLPALPYTDPTLTSGLTIIRAAHITELRDGVQ